MTTKARTVKKRNYDSTLRRERAEATRASVLDSALRSFLDRGYARTTVTAIASEAGVSPETIYKSFGNKRSLVLALRDRALAGSGPVHAEERSDTAKHSNMDPRRIIATWAQLSTEVAPRLTPILLVVRAAAAADTELAALDAELDAARLARMTDNARALDEHGHLRPGITVDRAADTLYACTMPELYDTLVNERGWTNDDYTLFIERTLTAALLT